MKAVHGATGIHQVEVRYVNTGAPGVVDEGFEGYLSDYGDLSPEEILLQQESVYESLQINAGIDGSKASVSTESNSSQEQSGGQRQILDQEGESSQAVDIKSQLELDEALALSLMELDIQNGDDETTVREAVNSEEVNRQEPSMEAAREDNMDPDNMTYEQLQSLGETIGVESRGLSEELISYLPTYKYKIGLFSRKEKHEDCVICYAHYKNKDMLTTLPCQHQYHSHCITKWLKLNKTCPVCNDEVFGS